MTAFNLVDPDPELSRAVRRRHRRVHHHRQLGRAAVGGHRVHNCKRSFYSVKHSVTSFVAYIKDRNLQLLSRNIRKLYH